MYRNLPLRMMGTIIRPRRPRRPRLSDFGMGQFSHVQPGTLMYPDVPCTSSWCGCPSWENPRKSASLFTMFEPSHLVCPCSQFDSLNRLLNRLLNPTFASVCSQRWSQLKPNLAHLLGGAAGQRGPERMAPGGTGGCTSDPFESPRDRSLCRSNGSHRG